MKSPIHIVLQFFFCLCVILLLNSTAPAEVTVQLADGRELSGEVDVRTDEHLLWIRTESEQVTLATSVPWSSVTAAVRDGESISLENLSEVLRKLATTETVEFVLQPVVYKSPGEKHLARASKSTPRIRSLEIDAFLVNFDRDVEPDGIELVIAALDEFGVAVPVKGSLYARLWGERIQPHGSHVRFEDLQLWTQQVELGDFFEGAASYELRFRRVRPEFDFGLHSEALVHVRLGVTGQGNFAATVPIQIRKFNRFRDQLQLYQGSRFFRGELTEEIRQLDRSRVHTRYRSWGRRF